MSKEAREALVLAHMASENRHAYDGTRKPFVDGLAAAAGYYEATRRALPVRRDELVCERVHFAPATAPARLGPAPSLPLPA